MDRNTELRRLAQALHKKPEELDYLDALDGLTLQKLRNRFQNSLLDKFGPIFEKIANAGKLAPDSVSATLCTKVFGPAITANMSYYTPLKKAIGLAGHFDADFMAEVAREQIPERAKDMLAGLPVELMQKVTAKLVKHGDFHVLGGFMDFMPEDKAAKVMEVIEDPASSLHISTFAQQKDRVARLTTHLTDEKLLELIAAAFTDDALTVEVGLITSELKDKEQQRMAKLTDKVNKEFRARAKEVADKMGYSDKLAAYFAA